jgi:thiamine transport system substrate-binding protein
MNKNHIFITIGVCFLISVTAGCTKKTAGAADSQRMQEVIAYTYDSFAGEWGPAGELAKRFKEKTGLSVTFINCGDGVQILSRAILEKDAPQADMVIGLDNNTAAKAGSAHILQAYKPAHADEVIPADLHTLLGAGWELTPYDYSHFAMIYDTQSSVPAPHSLDDLTKPVYAKKIILMDPRTSTPGLGFLTWTVAQYGKNYPEYWKALKPNILTMAPGWSAGYGLFTSGEAPLVISYTTSPAYHVEYDKTDRYQALIFAEGHPVQVEGAGILKGAANKKGAQLFMDFFISEEAQSVLPLTQWMYPANKNVALPDSYTKAAPKPAKTLTAGADETEAAIPAVMKILGE